MNTTEFRSNGATGIVSVKNVDMKLEMVVNPVSDADRAKEFYETWGGGSALTSPGVTPSV